MTIQGFPKPQSGLIAPDDSILLIIDLQEGFLKKLTEPRREAIVDRCRFLVEVASRFGVPTFVTVEDPQRNGGTAERVRACLDRHIPHREKNIFGLCSQDDLRAVIKDQPKRTALLAGMETDVCILHSAVSLMAEGFRSVIVSDATESSGSAHDQGLARAQALDVEIISTRGLYYEWIRSLERLAIAEAAPRIAPPLGIVL